jgi:hypothetical protein
VGCKGPGTGSSPGYWGRNIHQRIVAENTAERIKTLLIDKLLSLGKDVYLWTQITDITPGALECSCVKDTTKRADIPCNSCYGTKYIPGYVKFAHETLVFPSIKAGVVLTDVHLDTGIKPHRILLDDGQLTGSIEFPAIPFSNANYNWTYKLDAPNIVVGNTIEVEYSVNPEPYEVYNPIANINDINIRPVGVGNIYIKVTLTRSSVDDRSPEFEVFRLRHQTVNEPYIKILRPQVTEVPTWLQHGLRSEQLGERFWTAPLDFFDRSIIKNTPAARIIENSFYQRVTGINSDSRYVTVKLSYNEEFGIFTHQSFETRKTQPQEVYSRLVF